LTFQLKNANLYLIVRMTSNQVVDMEAAIIIAEEIKATVAVGMAILEVVEMDTIPTDQVEIEVDEMAVPMEATETTINARLGEATDGEIALVGDY